MSRNLSHHDQPTPDRDLNFRGFTMLWMIENWYVVEFFGWSKKLCSKYHKGIDTKFVEKLNSEIISNKTL